MADTRVRAPERTLTAVRAIAPVAACRRRPEATGPGLPDQFPVGVVRDRWATSSPPPRAEQGFDGGQRGDRQCGTDQVTAHRIRVRHHRRGRWEGSARCEATGTPNAATITVAATTAVSDSGMARCNRGSAIINVRRRTRRRPAGRQAASQSAWVATRPRRGQRAGAGRRRGARRREPAAEDDRGDAERENPSITGQGMKVTARPSQ